MVSDSGDSISDSGTINACGSKATGTPPGGHRSALRSTLRSVRKTSVYLPPALKDRLGDVARRTGRSEAHLIRLAIERLVDDETARLGRAG